MRLLIVIALSMMSALKADPLKGPETFGKSHFILGYTGPVDRQEKPITAPAVPSQLRILFSPDDDVRSELLNLINGEQTMLCIAMFAFTDQDIADALLAARNRGVRIEIISDPVCLHDKNNKITYLCDEGICTMLYNPQYDAGKQSSVMHHKFALFKCPHGGAPLVWTGSFNFTRSASRANQENVIITTDPSAVKRFNDQFTVLKKRARHYHSRH